MNEELRRRMEAHRDLPQKTAAHEESEKKARLQAVLEEGAWFDRMMPRTAGVWQRCVELLTAHGYSVRDRPISFKGPKIAGEMSVKSNAGNRAVWVRLWLDRQGYVFRLRGLENEERHAPVTLTEDELLELLLDLVTRPFQPYTATG